MSYLNLLQQRSIAIKFLKRNFIIYITSLICFIYILFFLIVILFSFKNFFLYFNYNLNNAPLRQKRKLDNLTLNYLFVNQNETNLNNQIVKQLNNQKNNEEGYNNSINT